MDEKRIQRALETIMMDESVTGELVDDEADALLGWGEQQVAHLAGQIADDDAFDEAANHLRKLMRHINTFVGQRHDLDDDQQGRVLQALVTVAQDLGCTITVEAAQACAVQSGDDNQQLLRSLTESIHIGKSRPKPDSLVDDLLAPSTEAAQPDSLVGDLLGQGKAQPRQDSLVGDLLGQKPDAPKPNHLASDLLGQSKAQPKQDSLVSDLLGQKADDARANDLVDNLLGRDKGQSKDNDLIDGLFGSDEDEE